MSRYWSATVKNIKPYIPGEQPKDRRYIKLNTNENPYPPSPNVIEAIKLAANDTLRTDFRRIRPPDARIVLVEALDRILTAYPESLSVKAKRQLQGLGHSGGGLAKGLLADVDDPLEEELGLAHLAGQLAEVGHALH